jgi:diketogulonate reductase-like aldo/keto reductase
MRYETLPDGAPIPVLGLGTWQFGGESTADYARDAEFVDILQQLMAMGYTHIDTAEGYAQGHAEELVGLAMRGLRRSDLFITTKVSPSHLRPDDVERAIDGSLRRLQTDYVDMYLIHWPSHDIPLEESFRGLNKLVADGRVRRIGVSNFDVPLLQRSMALCATPVATNQVLYNLLRRETAADGVLAFCQEHGILFTAYSPLKHDVLTHPEVIAVARAHGVTPAQVALAWVLRQPRVITIPKTASVQRAAENLAALSLVLTEDDVHRLDAIA